MGNTVAMLTTMMLMTGCVTIKGAYQLSAVDAAGKEISTGLALTAQGRGIYSVRNALCQRYPGATVIIKDSKTGEQLIGESPFKCR